MNANNNFVNAAAALKKRDDVRLVTSVSEGTQGITMIASIFCGEAMVVQLSRYVPFSLVTLPIQDDLIMDAITLATGAFAREMSEVDLSADVVEEAVDQSTPTDITGGTPVTIKQAQPSKRKHKVHGALIDGEAKPDSVEVISSDAGSSREKKECALMEESSGADGKITAMPAAAASLTIESAGEVLLELSKRGKHSGSLSSLGDFVGKPLRELNREKASFIRVIATYAGTEYSLVTREVEEAAKVLYEHSLKK